MSDDAYILRDILGAGDGLETARLPAPRMHRRAPRRALLRMRATETLLDICRELPAAGESFHIVSGSKFDFWTCVPALIQLAGPAAALYCSTWTLSRANAVELFELWDAEKVRTASFLTGTYFKRRETAVYSLLLDGIRKRGGRYRAFQNHAKVLLLDCPDAPLVVEGSANLTANPRLEQYVLSRDAALFAFHRGWMEEVLEAPSAAAVARVAAGPQPDRVGFSHRRAGLGVLAYTNNPGERRRVIAWKTAAFEAAETTDRLAAAVVELVRTWSPTLPPGAVVTYPPQGASFPGTYYAARLAARVAELLAVPVAATLERTDTKTRHHPTAALAQTAFCATVTPEVTYIVVDDLITSGSTMRLALDALRGAGAAAFGFAYSGS